MKDRVTLASRFKALSIKRKLNFIVMLASGAALILAFGALAVYDVLDFRQRMRDDLRVVAQGLELGLIPALDFGDTRGAENVLQTLSVREHTMAACVFDEQGALFARYVRSDVTDFEPPSAGPEATRFIDDKLVLFRSVRGPEGNKIGTVYLESDMEGLSQRLRDYVQIGVLVLLVSILAAYVLSSRLQRVITRPIEHLVEIETRVSREQDYTLRAQKEADDELGRAIDGFNEMLVQIQSRDAELTVAKEVAEQANRTKSAFLANMSHELRTPLNAIIGYSEMLQEEAVDVGQDDFVPDLEKIHAAGKHLLALINDILDLSKIESGKMELCLESFDVLALIRDVRSTIYPLVEKNGNVLEVLWPDTVPHMYADVTRVRQVLFNLLSNASKFTEKGTITLELLSEKDAAGRPWLLFNVKDTGIGLTPVQVGRLFQAFSQADASTSRKYGGTGLGLVISRRFCQIMGGDITVASEHGHGSTFTVRLPLQVGEKSEASGSGISMAEKSLVATHAAAVQQGVSVLVIDDDANARELLQRGLSREGFSVEVAATGEEGVRMARETHPDIVTLDVLMPGMDGWAVLRALKGASETADIPVIMISMVDDKDMGDALGAADYLHKPVEREHLVELLRRYHTGKDNASVLVVEDDAPTREMIRRTLQAENWAVSEAANGKIALELLAHIRPELILLDLMMPEMDGFEFVAELRRHKDWRTIPVVVLTAKDLTAQDRLRLDGNVRKIFQKGTLSRVELAREIRAVLGAPRRSPAGDATS